MTATITIHGGLTAPPELRYGQSGVAIAAGTIASTDRYLDRQTNEWRDGRSLYVRYSAFKELAENIAASGLDKGSQVVVTGKLHTRSYKDRDGNPKSVTELEVTDFAVSLKRAVAEVTKSGPATPKAQARAEVAAGVAEPWSAPGEYGDDTPF